MSNAGAFVLQKASTRVIIVNGVEKRLRMPINIKCVSWKVFIKKEVNSAWGIVRVVLVLVLF